MRQAHHRPLEIRHVRREGLFQQYRPFADIPWLQEHSEADIGGNR
jgi:hypothetical protein